MSNRSQNKPIMGRPVVYKANDNRDRHIAKLIKDHSALTAQKILRAGPRDAMRQHRNLDLIPEPLKISYPTLLKIARRHNVQLQVGRPATSAKAVA